MSFVELLLLLRKVPIRDLLNYPDDLRDEVDVRRWLVAVCEAGDILAELTDTTIDDAVIDAFRSVVSDAQAFSVIYTIILDIFYTDDKMDLVKIGKAADAVGIAPALIIAIVQLVVMILKFIKDRKGPRQYMEW